MTTLEKAIGMLLQTFDKYASSDGNPNSLTKAEIRTLVKNELPGLVEAAKNRGDMDKQLKDLEMDGEAELELPGFMFLVALLVCAHHDRPCHK